MMKAIAGLRLIYPDSKGYFSFYSGIAAFYQNNYPAAIQEFKAALEKNGENYEAWLYLGKTLEKTGNEVYAKNAYQQAERLKATAEPSSLLEEPPDLFLY